MMDTFSEFPHFIIALKLVTLEKVC
nr:unnamed protein product [Callosobruchus analis]